MEHFNNDKGFTFVEIIIALGAIVMIFASMASAFMAIESLNSISRHNIQATEIVRGEIETLKGTAFSTLVNSVNTVTFDAGADGVFGNADDQKGTLTVTVIDALDMDGDGNGAETSIDVDGDGINDPTSALPVRVTFAWTQWVLGTTKTYAVAVNTLIAA